MDNDQLTSQNISKLFLEWAGTKPLKIKRLPQSASYRKYYRLEANGKTAIGVFNKDKKENTAFIEFSKHFLSKNINVPKVYKENLEQNCYLIEDIGDTVLFSHLNELKKENKWDEIENLYKKVLTDLYTIQTKGGEGLDYSLCYPCISFDMQSMQWDLNYFKYHFLKVAKIPFDEQKLEDDFYNLSHYLLQADNHYFMFRDFQSRNIMLKNNSELYYIDYQGGRKGALQYDVASLLFESKQNLPLEFRTKLLDHYAGLTGNRNKFIEYYYPYVLIRLMQVMGAYGFRGLIERKVLFVQSIPLVIESLKWILENVSFKVNIPEIIKAFNNIINSEYLNSISDSFEKLTIDITSFSYKQGGVPDDLSGNGGGHVFDCRHLHNPGRYDEYKSITGRDEPVIKFLDSNNDIQIFLKNVEQIIDQAVDNYLERGFNHLSVSFGCTGGQHRSVYSAERINAHLKEKYKNKLTLVLKHREI